MNFDFKKLSENEAVVSVLGDHWVVFLSPFSLYFVGNALGVFLLMLSGNLEGLMSVIFCSLSMLVLLVTQHAFFIALISLELSTRALTSERVIDFSFLPYVRHDMSYINIRDIKEVEKKQRGILRNLLHYGDVEIVLTSSSKPILFRSLPYPGRFVDLVSRLKRGRVDEEL